MKITRHADYHQMSIHAKDFIINSLQQKKESLICAATGNSPLKTYHLLAAEFQQNIALFEQLRILKLDEWGGVEMQEPQTCESFLQENLLQPLHISRERYFAFESNPENPQQECNRVQAIINQQGPIDLCILGLGRNGHLGFNEPAEILQPHCHVVELSATSMQHSMAQAMQQKPTYGMTIGMVDILHSKKIILLVTGDNKKAVVTQLLEQRISTQLPTSLLWLHPNVECAIDEQVMGTNFIGWL